MTGEGAAAGFSRDTPPPAPSPKGRGYDPEIMAVFRLRHSVFGPKLPLPSGGGGRGEGADARG